MCSSDLIGDAYSDYQGFIEGALRSTGRLLNFYTAGASSIDFSDRHFLETMALDRA